MHQSPVGWVDAVPTQHLQSPNLLGCEKDATQPTHHFVEFSVINPNKQI